MHVVETIQAVRQVRWADPTAQWGLVPTMGFLHEGHLSLVRLARRDNDRVGVSIFVNPTQFNDPRDLSVYPRDLERDLALLEEEGADLVWTPSPETVYPPGYQTHVTVADVTRRLEGGSRPGHFQGVATVVSKLFNVFQPQRAYFGQKDAQQAVTIKRLVADLDFNLQIIVGATVREADGLAMSSRNANLSPALRPQAGCLYQALCAAKDAVAQGQRDAEQLRSIMRAEIAAAAAVEEDYISVADPETLEELSMVANRALLSLAVYLDGVRLIDNMVVQQNTK
jgi:pantoate--beta-alanine ligase